MSKPEIRFPEFSESWIKSKISEHFVFKNGINKEKEAFGKGTPIINFKDVYNERVLKSENIKGLITISDKEKSAFLVKKGDLFFTRTSETPSDIGMSASLLEEISECIFSGFVLRARPISDDLIPAFNAYRFSTNSVRKEIITKSSFTTRALTSGSLLNEVKFFFPQNKNEQEKIADFLSAVDEKIRLLKEKHALFQQYKKGVMQKLFSQEIRFKDDNGQAFPDWRLRKLSELLFEHKQRNTDLKFSKNDVLSVSGDTGIVNQIEHLGRSYAGESVANYHVVHEGDIVYTKSPLKSNPYGIIKGNKGKAGIVSTLYAVYSCKSEVSYEYLDQYFSIHDNVNRYLRPLVHKGAKNDMKINNQRVLIDSISIPSYPEQLKIASFLDTIDGKVDLIKQQIELTQTFKKGLLQQMFV